MKMLSNPERSQLLKQRRKTKVWKKDKVMKDSALPSKKTKQSIGGTAARSKSKSRVASPSSAKIHFRSRRARSVLIFRVTSTRIKQCSAGGRS